MVDVLDVALFSAGDLPQSLFSRLRTLALKTPPHSQKLVPLRSKSSPSEQFACGGGSQNIFSQIDSHSFAGLYWQNIGQIKDKVKKPSISSPYQFRFLRHSNIDKRLVESADLKRNLNTAFRSKQRENGPFQRIRSLVKMDRASFFKQQLLWAFLQGLFIKKT